MNWITVYTVYMVVNYTMEIVGVNHGVTLEIKSSMTSLYRDGKCKKAYCYATNFLTPDQNRCNLMKMLKLSESKRECSHEAYGGIVIISENEYGGLVDFDEKVAFDEYGCLPTSIGCVYLVSNRLIIHQ